MNELVQSTPRRSLGVFIASLFLLLALMSYQVTDPNTGRSVLGNIVFRMLSPLQVVIASTVSTVFGAVSNYIAVAGAKQENVRLQKEVAELKIQLDILQRQRQENERLREILQLGQKTAYDLIVGEVIAWDAKSAVSDTITVNRGRRHGVKMQMPVVTPRGIVGFTIMVEDIASKVLLITDASASVGAMLHDSRIAGLLTGIQGGRCILRFLPLNTILKKDAIVVTSGQDGIFPEGLRVGKVTAAILESEFYKSAEVQPFPNFTSLAEVVYINKVEAKPPGAPAAATQPDQ